MFTCQAGNSTTIVDISHHKKTYEYVFFYVEATSCRAKPKKMFIQFALNAPQQMGLTSNLKKIQQRRELIEHAWVKGHYCLPFYQKKKQEKPKDHKHYPCRTESVIKLLRISLTSFLLFHHFLCLRHFWAT